MFGIPTILGFGIMAFAFMFLGYVGRDLRIFRFLFLLAGFLSLYGMVTSLATLSLAYTVPPSNTAPYYTASTVSSTTSLLYAYGYAIEVAIILYVAIELVLFIKAWLEAAANRRKAKLNYETGVSK